MNLQSSKTYAYEFCDFSFFKPSIKKKKNIKHVYKTKVVSEIRVFQHLLTDLNRRRDLTGRNKSTSRMRSLERIEGTVSDGVIVMAVNGDGNDVMKVDGGDGLLTVTPLSSATRSHGSAKREKHINVWMMIAEERI